jgi:hypothetical protein
MWGSVTEFAELSTVSELVVKSMNTQVSDKTYTSIDSNCHSQQIVHC